jgi:hypothetical protein
VPPTLSAFNSPFSFSSMVRIDTPEPMLTTNIGKSFIELKFVFLF